MFSCVFRLERLTDEDLKKCEEFSAVMEVLYKCTNGMSTSKYPTAGQAIPILQKLEQNFTVGDDDTEFL